MAGHLPLDAFPSMQPIPFIDGELHFLSGLYRKPLTATLLQQLLQETPWRQESVNLWGKRYPQPRLSAWYGDPGRAYSYSGVVLHPLPWTATLTGIKNDVEHMSGHRFNSVLLNYYRDQNDSVGWHSDAERELGEKPVIASLSFGEARIFRMRHKKRKDVEPVSMELGDGSLLLMSGATQQFWQHAVGKERVSRGARVNLTFRNVLDQV